MWQELFGFHRWMENSQHAITAMFSFEMTAAAYTSQPTIERPASNVVKELGQTIKGEL
jgi:hypothetical protein